MQYINLSQYIVHAKHKEMRSQHVVKLRTRQILFI